MCIGWWKLAHVQRGRRQIRCSRRDIAQRTYASRLRRRRFSARLVGRSVMTTRLMVWCCLYLPQLTETETCIELIVESCTCEWRYRCEEPSDDMRV